MRLVRLGLEARASEFLSLYGLDYSVEINFSRKFKPFNANVRRSGTVIVFSLSHSWASVSEEITLGLLHSLLIRVCRLKPVKTTSIDLYSGFVKNLQSASPRTSTDPELESSFQRVNDRYFSGLLDIPNFEWHSSRHRLASYNHYTDTVSVSHIFKGMSELIDYLMYHELLHKKLKFRQAASRTSHHGSHFRELERSFENAELLEKRVNAVARKSGKFWLR